jgi:hypothetical protein
VPVTFGVNLNVNSPLKFVFIDLVVLCPLGSVNSNVIRFFSKAETVSLEIVIVSFARAR